MINLAFRYIPISRETLFLFHPRHLPLAGKPFEYVTTAGRYGASPFGTEEDAGSDWGSKEGRRQACFPCSPLLLALRWIAPQRKSTLPTSLRLDAQLRERQETGKLVDSDSPSACHFFQADDDNPEVREPHPNNLRNC